MEKGFLDQLRVKRNALVGVVIGFVVAAAYFRGVYLKESLRYPILLYAGLSLVSLSVIALFVTILLTLVRWIRLGVRARRDEDPGIETADEVPEEYADVVDRDSEQEEDA
ncbi:MAG: hypothetical protein SV760_01645 [Halobacteria archaeon]|nr:hypothetical protein [Halobacteria archaeon]